MTPAVFCGDDCYLSGEPATIYAVAGTDMVIAQFHNTNLRRGVNRYGYGWHVFKATDFKEPDHET